MGNPPTYGRGESDGLIVPEKPANNGRGEARPAEPVEERGPAKGNLRQQNRVRAQAREALQSALERVRQVATEKKEERFRTLWHHVYNTDRLREAYLGLKPKAAAGVDGVTWRQYGEDLEGNLQDLSSRLKRGAYRAKPVRRVYIPKDDGRQRPIGVPTLEDKIVQRATVEVLNAVYETDFLGFSYGFRPGRSQHNALDALAVGIQTKKVNWVLDADVRGFFDAISHEWIVRFVEHRIADKRVLRHVRKWLNAGVLEKDRWYKQDEGTPQGGSVSPLLANIYLHYAFDLWAHQWRSRQARGDVVIVRYADDFIVGFQHRPDAERFLSELTERLLRFGLELHPDKTRLIRFGRYAAQNRAERGERKPETFDFLGFTHMCGTSRKGKFVVKRKTMRKRIRRKRKEVKQQLRKRLHHRVPEVGGWLAAVLRGHYQYYGVPYNYPGLATFRWQVVELWYRALRRRSQRTKTTWKRIERLAERWLPLPRIHHPHPWERLCVTTQGRSPVR
jgi:group II intron reverse transcriptase/maturase